MAPVTTFAAEELHSVNPYEGFRADEYPLDLQGWGSEHPIFRKVLEEIKPQLIIEVGSWKGASAIHMARCLKDLGLQAKILCIDTWLGAIEFWGDKQDPERYLSLSLKNGYPTIFYQFLANVVKSGFQDVIVPFPQTSVTAARWLRQHGVQADAIYVDGSHEEEDVFLDLCSYWQVVAPGGVMFGDDYDQYWPSVRSAVRRFAQVFAIEYESDDRKWLFRKPNVSQDKALACEEGSALNIANSIRFEVLTEQLAILLQKMEVRRDYDRVKQELQSVRAEAARFKAEASRLQSQLNGCAEWWKAIQQSHTWQWFARHAIKLRFPLDV
jgi:hypothetical protein